MAKVARKRACRECGRTFVNPNSLLKHKNSLVGCRTDEALLAIGFKLTPQGWSYGKLDRTI